MISEKQAMLEVLKENQDVRANTKFARNMLVVKTLRKIDINVLISYKDFPKFSFDSLCSISRQLRKSPEGRAFFDDRKGMIPEEEREFEQARIEAASPGIKFEPRQV